MRDETVSTVATQFGQKRMVIVQKAMSSGAWFLMPKELAEIVRTFEPIQSILREDDFTKLKKRVNNYGDKIEDAAQVARRLLGLEAAEPTI